MINLLHVENYTVNTSQFSPLLNDKIVQQFEEDVCDFVGAKYACSIHSATMAIFFSLLEKEKQIIDIPSIMPPVVPNAIITSGHSVNFVDDIDWVGSSYILKDFGSYKIIDSAQQLDRNQFMNQANDEDLMIFSFYPTKPVGGLDEKIDRLKVLSRYGMSLADNSWERKLLLPGWKMYMNSVQCYIAHQNLLRLEQKQKRFDEIRSVYNSEFGANNVSRHLYRLNVEDNTAFLDIAKQKGIQCGIHYKALHLNDIYKSTHLSLAKSEKHHHTTISIPFHEKLTDEQVYYIIKEIKPYVIA